MRAMALVAAAVATIFTAAAPADEGIDDHLLGLSMLSVFYTPVPATFEYDDQRARTSKSGPRAFAGAPPQIPHEVESMLPITRADNQCLECHERGEDIGKEEVRGGTPMDKAHYYTKGDPSEWSVSGARYNCGQCHVPQADVEPLVPNTFVSGR